MGLHNESKLPKKSASSYKVRSLKKHTKTPTLKLMTKAEIENNRISAYEFVI